MRNTIPRPTQAQRCITAANDFIQEGRHREAARNLKVAATPLEMEAVAFNPVIKFERKRK